jgi:predicted nucleic acid-binding protein
MTKKPKAYVLDSWAVISYFQDEPAAEKVEHIISDAHEHDIPMLMTVVNAGEVWYVKARRSSPSAADKAIQELRQLGIHFVEIDWTLAHEAGAFKAKHRMSFADCFAAALAKQRKAHLVTGDPELKQVEQEITIEWLTK